jgi:hypothetical protein
MRSGTYRPPSGAYPVRRASGGGNIDDILVVRLVMIVVVSVESGDGNSDGVVVVEIPVVFECITFKGSSRHSTTCALE